MTATEVTTTRQVVITEIAAQVVEALVPQAPAMVDVITEGPQGPEGPVAQPLSVRIDATTPETIYVGTAQNGTIDSDAAWAISRTTYSAAGIRTSKGTAAAVTWTGRASHSYS